MCGLCDGVRDAMIHLGEFLIPPGLLANVVHGVVFDVLYIKPSLICNEFPGIYIGVINHQYI